MPIIKRPNILQRSKIFPNANANVPKFLLRGLLNRKSHIALLPPTSSWLFILHQFMHLGWKISPNQTGITNSYQTFSRSHLLDGGLARVYPQPCYSILQDHLSKPSTFLFGSSTPNLYFLVLYFRVRVLGQGPSFD